MNIVKLNGLALPVAVDDLEMTPEEIGEAGRAASGKAFLSRRAIKRTVAGHTSILGPSEARRWQAILEERGATITFEQYGAYTNKGVAPTLSGDASVVNDVCNDAFGGEFSLRVSNGYAFWAMVPKRRDGGDTGYTLSLWRPAPYAETGDPAIANWMFKHYVVVFDPQATTPYRYFVNGSEEFPASTAMDPAYWYTRGMASADAGTLFLYGPRDITQTWSPSIGRSLGNAIRPTVPNGFTYVKVNAGTHTAGSTEPAWPTSPGATVNDGGIVWKVWDYDVAYWDEVTWLPFAIPADHISEFVDDLYNAGPEYHNWGLGYSVTGEWIGDNNPVAIRMRSRVPGGAYKSAMISGTASATQTLAFNLVEE